jgi:hypothetical protein
LRFVRDCSSCNALRMTIGADLASAMASDDDDRARNVGLRITR